MVIAFLESKAKGPSFSLHLQIGLEAIVFFVYRFSLESKRRTKKKRGPVSPRKNKTKQKNNIQLYTAHEKSKKLQ
jgi:hypothetical protein